MSNNQKEKTVIDWKNVFKVALILFVITAVSALLLAVTNHYTSGPIAEQQEQTNIAARKTVLPAADRFEAVEEIEKLAQKAYPDNPELIREAFIGYQGQKPAGITVKTAPKGFGGEIEMIVGISTDGKVNGIEIISLEETAGLGAKADSPEFKEQYQGLDAKAEITVIKDGSSAENAIDAITGATITSKAVTQGTNAACALYREMDMLMKGGQ